MRKKTSILLVVLALMQLMACTNNGSNTTQTAPATVQPGDLQVYFIDVGKGDAALIGLPGSRWVMVDTGPKEGFPEIGRTLIKHGVTHLDAIFVTHGHKDHIGGLNSVLKIAKSDCIYTIPDCLDDKEISDAKEEFGIEIKTTAAGQSIQIADAVFDVLGPLENYEDENENSMVLKLVYKDKRILFTADQLSRAEKGLLDSGKDLAADVLKVAYHGGAESTSAQFVKAVSPAFAVIPTDETRPAAQQTLSVLAQAGAQTSILGDTGTLFYNGTSLIKVPVPAGEVPDVSVSEKDTKAEFVTITNNTQQAIDLTGWCLYSEKGADVYFFPSETVLPANNSLTVYSGKMADTNQGGLVWTSKNIWSNKKDDICLLFDASGRLVSSR